MSKLPDFSRIHTSPFPPNIHLTEIHQIRVKQCASLRPAVSKYVAQEFPQENVAEPVIFAGVEQEREEVGMTDFLPFDGKSTKDVGLAHRQFELLEIRIGNGRGQSRFKINFLGHCPTRLSCGHRLAARCGSPQARRTGCWRKNGQR